MHRQTAVAGVNHDDDGFDDDETRRNETRRNETRRNETRRNEKETNHGARIGPRGVRPRVVCLNSIKLVICFTGRQPTRSTVGTVTTRRTDARRRAERNGTADGRPDDGGGGDGDGGGDGTDILAHE